MTDRRSDLRDFYEMLAALEAFAPARRLKDCSAAGWPERGVEFFFEAGETRAEGGGLRVVRVGTHGLKTGAATSFWSRVSQHRGPASGVGNHRGSVFRRHVGAALLARDGLDLPSWGQGASAPQEIRAAEAELERRTSAHLGEMRLLALSLPDAPGPQSLRGVVKRGAIALLSASGREAIDPPSPGWLGRHAESDKLRASGLWNADHVDEAPDPQFLRLFERLLRAAAA